MCSNACENRNSLKFTDRRGCFTDSGYFSCRCRVMPHLLGGHRGISEGCVVQEEKPNSQTRNKHTSTMDNRDSKLSQTRSTPMTPAARWLQLSHSGHIFADRQATNAWFDDPSNTRDTEREKDIQDDHDGLQGYRDVKQEEIVLPSSSSPRLTLSSFGNSPSHIFQRGPPQVAAVQHQLKMKFSVHWQSSRLDV